MLSIFRMDLYPLALAFLAELVPSVVRVSVPLRAFNNCDFTMAKCHKMINRKLGGVAIVDHNARDAGTLRNIADGDDRHRQGAMQWCIDENHPLDTAVQQRVRRGLQQLRRAAMADDKV